MTPYNMMLSSVLYDATLFFKLYKRIQYTIQYLVMHNDTVQYSTIQLTFTFSSGNFVLDSKCCTYFMETEPEQHKHERSHMIA